MGLGIDWPTPSATWNEVIAIFKMLRLVAGDPDLEHRPLTQPYYGALWTQHI